MELLQSTRTLLLLSLILHQTSAHNIVATCAKTNDLMPKESWIEVQSNPSPLHDLDLQLIGQSRPLDPLSLKINWSINIDGSIHSITGTWIEVSIRSHTSSSTVKYRCDYQPAFTSNQCNYTGLEELRFSFTSTDVHIEPEGVYKAVVNNLPAGPSNTQSKSKEVAAPGCENKQMSTHSICSEEKPLKIIAVHKGDEIEVTFESQAGSLEYEILLIREDEKLNHTIEKTSGKIRTIIKKFPYPGPCENLTVLIKPHLKKCGRVCSWEERDVKCYEKPELPPIEDENPFALICTGCAVALILMLICLCALFGLRKLLSKRGLNPVFTGPVRVLMVYPAVDSVFQHAVMTLADFLQSHKDLNVVIDMWQRGSLAEQGPLRWLHSQADQADKVLIILQSPQHQQIHTSIHIHTDHQKPHMVPGMPDYTVPASAQELYFLALNLVASSAHEPKHHHKFWVVHMNQGGERCTVPVQLRGCKTLRLPRDLNTLHQKLSSRQGQKCRSWRIWSIRCILNSKKVRHALLQLDRSQINHSESENAHLTGGVQVSSKGLIP
ncbi:interleukin-17 receptor B [Astyanax mexicanus]|uniref:interleukin-17 receptor B n=1 Tax=Astyanax mexicanus TaxID=7994 RepID=UPI0020CAC10F|nr:interleukin-17 receptor B [Astyanax mexicanus]